MAKERTNISITERQKKQLQKRSEQENLPIAERIRRALDAYLAWDDPTTRLIIPIHPKQGRAIHPRLKSAWAFWPDLVIDLGLMMLNLIKERKTV